MTAGVPIRQMELLESWRIYRRARRTIGCTDCEGIAKTSDAGKVIAEDRPYQVMHNNVKIRLGGYHGAWMSEVIRALGGHHEPQEERIFYEVLNAMPPDAVMLELGSYWAYYSLWFKQHVPHGRTFMIEPVPDKLQVGIENFGLNRAQGVFRNAFIGSSSSESDEFVDWDGSVSKLPCIAIDDFLEKEEIGFLNILHADIQGAELDMLKGCRRSLEDCRIGYLFISTHAGKHEACLAEVRRVGYKMVAEHSIEESCSGDGLIVARSECVPEIPSVHITKSAGAGRVHENVAALIDLVTSKKHRRLWKAIRAGQQ